MGWDKVKESASGDFTKLEAGKTVRLHLLGAEPDVKFQHWDANKKCHPCTAPDCQFCVESVKRSARFSIKVFNMDSKRVEVLESGIAVFGQINAIREALDGTLSGVDLKISRTGSGANDTKYMVVNVPTAFVPEMAEKSKQGNSTDEPPF